MADNHIHNAKILGFNQKPILIDLRYSKPSKSKLLVIFCHGFKGFKDWGSFNYIANMFTKNGIAFLKFNFSHNGTTPEEPTKFIDLEAFAKNNYSIELFDLEMVFKWVKESLSTETDFCFEKILLMGHSRGGGIALLETAKNKNIDGLITWASVSDFEKRLATFPVEEWKKKGVIYIPNTRTGQNMPLNFKFYEDYYQNKNELDIRISVPKINVPWLIVHAADDSVVNIDEAKSMAMLNRDAKLNITNGGGHTFGAAHPFDDENISNHLTDAINKSINFIFSNYS